ncbi:hypothetical protein Q5752_006498 [Cryptotrichosporon argae]
MPLQTRRPNLPSLQLPTARHGPATAVDGFHTPIHTPLSATYTPAHFSHAMVMTPDTPAFDLAPLSALLLDTDSCKAPFLSAVSAAMSSSSSSCASSALSDADRTFTDAEDGTIQSYLLHPPRPIRTAYPPGTLPPPGALDEITSQLVATEMAKGVWRHSWRATRDRVFAIARQESMDSVGGLARPRLAAHTRSEPATSTSTDAAGTGLAERLALGGFAMNRQQHSMDSLYGDDAPAAGLSEAMRLSSSLQTASTQGPQSALTANAGLSSPLAFTFNYPQPPRKANKPFVGGITPVRPASLLQRGRSFTSTDILDSAEHEASDPSLKGVAGAGADDYALDMDADVDVDLCLGAALGGSRKPVRPAEMKRSVSSPVRHFVPSPPSSISSAATQSDDEDDARPDELDQPLGAVANANADIFPGQPASSVPADEDPITPLTQTFPRYTLQAPQHGLPRSSSSNSSIATLAGALTPTASTAPAPAPAFTLTVDSPDQAPTPRCAELNLPPVPGAPVQVVTHSSAPLTAPPPFHFPSPEPADPAPAATSSAVALPRVSAAPAPRRVRSPQRPVQLSRSLSDSTTLALASLSLSALPRSESAYVYDRDGRDGRDGGNEAGRESKRMRGGLSRAAGLGLSVLVPRPGGMASDELRSPFEHKPVSLA